MVFAEWVLLTMAILLVASEELELSPFAKRLVGRRALKWPLDYAEEGVWQGRRMILAANGAGPKLASQCVEVALRALTAAELSASKLEAVGSVGLCGALDQNLHEKQIIVASTILALDRGEDLLSCEKIEADVEFTEKLIVSTDRVAVTMADKEKLAARGAAGVEMEAAGVAQRTFTANLPFFCVKVVTDLADEEFVMDFNEMRGSDGRFSRGKIVIYAATHPSVFPKLWKFRRRCESAAEVLGAFLASCRFQFSNNALEL